MVSAMRYFEKDTDLYTQVITAAKKPSQIDDVAARAPWREEKKVAMRAGSAEPVKIPVMF
tara:strand:+ start:742 stop:921 length:180 start_codon:yes stop_codon:yes gene_type:complete